MEDLQKRLRLIDEATLIAQRIILILAALHMLAK
jgi:hypothetical protein